MATVVALPVAGAKEKGVGGFFAGLLGGAVVGGGIMASAVGVGNII